MKPACFENQKQWAEWRKLAARAPAHFCEDCTPEYHRLMMLEGRCEHPEVAFIPSRDDPSCLEGIVATQPHYAAAAIKGTRAIHKPPLAVAIAAVRKHQGEQYLLERLANYGMLGFVEG